MSRVPYRDATVLPPGIPPLNLFRMMAHSPSTLPHLLSLGTAAFRDTSLTPHLRELLCLWNAKRLHCEYQWKQHLPVAKQNSVTETQIAALLAEDISGEEWSLEERALLAFLDQVISMPEVDDGVFLEARNHFSDQVLVEVVTMQGLYYSLAKIATIFHVDVEQAFKGEPQRRADPRSRKEKG